MSNYKIDDNSKKNSISKKSLVITISIMLFILMPLAGIFIPKCFDNKLIKNGLPTKAKILKIRDTGNRFNEQPQVELLLEVHASGYAPYQTFVKMYISPVYLPQYQPGAQVNIKYDPKNPNKVVIESVDLTLIK
jgi:hypothetical protein